MSPEAEAGRLIGELGFSEPPIDVEHVCRHLGIELVFFDGKVGKILGASTSFDLPDGGRKTICSVNSRLGRGRKRFTIAHEIGHFVLGHFDGGPRKTPWQERDANRFASELLMPEQIICCDWCWFDIETLARRYGVSLQAITIRIKPYNLELVI